MAEQIGKVAAQALATPGTDSSVQLTVGWDGIDLSVLNALPVRLDDATLAKVEAIARLPVPALPVADEEFFAQCMRTLKLLPTRADDEVKGELRFAIYQRHLGKVSRNALAHLTDRAIVECRFFPSVSECLAIIDTYQRRDRPYRASQLARRAARQERQARFDAVMGQLAARELTQEQVDALPEQWCRIADERGYVRFADGRFIIRREPSNV